MKMIVKSSIVITSPIASFGFEILWEAAHRGNIVEGLDLLKKYFDGTIPTTIVTRKAHKGCPVDCNEFRIFNM